MKQVLKVNTRKLSLQAEAQPSNGLDRWGCERNPTAIPIASPIPSGQNDIMKRIESIGVGLALTQLLFLTFRRLSHFLLNMGTEFCWQDIDGEDCSLAVAVRYNKHY